MGAVQKKFHKIGRVSEIVDGGKALVFDIDTENFIRGFAIKFNEKFYCYRNQCPHTGSELDWVAGHFFDDDGKLLVCATHGAMFDPVNGLCLNGPCINQSLIPVPVRLEDDVILAFF